MEAKRAKHARLDMVFFLVLEYGHLALEDLIRFDEVTGKRFCRQQMVRKLVELDCIVTASDLLDENCDGETFELVLLGLQPKLPHGRKDYVKRDLLGRMKALGYKRSVRVFEKAILEWSSSPKEAYDLFLAMAEECEAGATPGCYNEVLNVNGFSRAMVIVKEAKLKNVPVDSLDVVPCMRRFLQDKAQVSEAVALLMEFGDRTDAKTATVIEAFIGRSDSKYLFEGVVNSSICGRAFPHCCRSLFKRPYLYGDRVPPVLLRSFFLVDDPDRDTCVGVLKCLQHACMIGEANRVYQKFPQYFANKLRT
ncbi:hypothetical protein SELMODRAFT_409966 [Selaginella moellendorffii]|uniref:Uncharacterized protein n=1 Tax=Selaginella moellendorffii TaxID=88036 RepID=D8RD16_SELML|nr:hypothetical protein SELMODRAFT_409966 [Selaginella moellendorffii]